MPDNLHLQCSFIVLRKDQAMIGVYMLVVLRSCLICPTRTQLLLLNVHSALLFLSCIMNRSPFLFTYFVTLSGGSIICFLVWVDLR